MMIKCPKKLSFDDRWIALSLLAHIIKSDTQMMSREITYLKEEISGSLGIDSSELSYFDELMNRDFNPADIDKIDASSDPVIAKHILKEALHLCLVDGNYSGEEKAILVAWAGKNGLGPSFIAELEPYIRLCAQGDGIDAEELQKATEAAEALLNG